ncbi:hypothetical protein HETIRDRAFT_419862 [Heterobasidion irregulare TC 32-1]|uniref:Uncharacterized protein n=1 Tax=Heterobasidion irregulare (strain TC 32-1) TaxID=747525 RepID=W4JYF9_HETIT|nr:uncharacterized protein HETIRDRAFT_419862 [Heterobasidion irregulare TC 32-1]ETW78607.1 hypothetical protein HETIRDRAFT_419862 [Heterobasidion irregulare TC 32-1]
MIVVERARSRPGIPEALHARQAQACDRLTRIHLDSQRENVMRMYTACYVRRARQARLLSLCSSNVVLNDICMSAHLCDTWLLRSFRGCSNMLPIHIRLPSDVVDNAVPSTPHPMLPANSRRPLYMPASLPLMLASEIVAP